MNRLSKLLVAATLTLAAGAAMAQAWPNRPVKFLVGQPPGAGPDIMARLLGERLQTIWGQSVVVENRAGGASIPGTMAAVQSAPDGYTYYMATGGVLLNVYSFKQLPYDPDKQLVPVAFIGKAPFMISVHPSVPANNLPELIAYLKANPGKLSIATEGPRNLGGMMTEYFMALTGTQMIHTPYNGAAAGLTAAIAGQSQVAMQSATATSPHAKAGKLRPIAVTSGSVVPGFENVPPLKNTYPDFEYVGWYMLYAPTGTPADIVARVNRDMDRVMKEPDTAKKLSDLGPVLEGAGTPESLARFTRQEHANWARLTKAINFQPE